MNLVLHTTSSYKELVDKESRLAADLALAQAQLFPLKKDNSRLTRENHQLHIDNIRQTDQSASMCSEQTVTIKKLQDDMVELNHVVKLKEEQLKRVEAEKERIREAYEELADPAIKAKNVRRVMKMSAPLPKGKFFGTVPASAAVPDAPPVDSTVIDSLRHQLDESHATLKARDSEIKRLQSAINARELELSRSAHAAEMSDGSVNRTEQLYAADVANKRIIDQLNGQVDFLNEQLALREAQLVETADKIIRADELQVELNQKNILYEKARTQNSELASQLRAMEFKVAELTEAVEPDGSVSVDDFFEMSSQNDSRSLPDFPPAAAPLQSSSYDSRDSGAGVSAGSRGSGQATRTSRDRGSSAVPRREASRQNAPPPPTSSSSSSAYYQPPGLQHRSSSSSAEVRGTSSITATVKAKHSSSRSSGGEHERTGGYQEQKQSGGSSAGGVVRDVESDIMVSKLSAEKSGLLGEVSRLNETLSELQSGDALVKERMRRGEEKLAAMKLELGDAKKQAETLARTLLQREEELKAVQKDLDQSQKNLKEAMSRLGSTASSSVELQSRADQTQGILADALREKKEKEAIVDTLRTELSKLRKEQVELVSGKETAEARLRVVEKEVQLLRQSSDKCVDELTDSKTEVVRLGLHVDSLESDLQIAKRKVEAEKQASLTAQDQLALKTSELVEATQKLALLQMSSAPSSGNDQLRNELKSLSSRCSDLESEKRTLMQEKRGLEQNLQSLLSQSQTQSQRSATSDTERLQLVSDLARRESELSGLEREKKRVELELDQAKALLFASEKACQSLRDRAMEREAAFASRGETSDALNSEIQLMSRRLQDAQESYAMARRQLDDTNDALIRSTERLGHADREVASLTELLSANKRDYEKLEMHSEGLQRQLEVTTKRANSEREELRRAAGEKSALEAKIQELKSLVANMEGTARSHSIKSTRLAAALEEEGEGMRRMESEKQSLRDAVSDRDRRLAQSQEALQHLDEERDRLQALLDVEQEQASIKDQARAHLDSQMLQLRQVLERTEKKLSAVNNDFAATQRQCAATEARLTSLKEENLELRRRTGQKSAELNGAAEDLMLMTKENQALTSELAETAAERDRLRNRLAEVVQAMASLEQARRAIEIERSDLLDSYRAVLNEKRKLENDLNALGAVKQRAGINAQHLQSQLAELQGVVSSHSESGQRFAMERTALTKQIETLNEEIVRAQRRSEAVEADNRRMMQVSCFLFFPLFLTPLLLYLRRALCLLPPLP
jgi:chromosome segregation ATPase